MKLALITTTINIPHVLALYRRYDPYAHVQFYVAGDQKTPIDTRIFCDALPGCTYIPPDKQLKWKCANLIPWNTIQRRNLALLEAVKDGADVIVSVDDDNIPLDTTFFVKLQHLFSGVFDGPMIEVGLNDWFDPGKLLIPPTTQRGFPLDEGWCRSSVQPATNAVIGVAQATILGDPDTSAVERIAKRPRVDGVSELLRSGVVVDPCGTWTIFNSQATAFRRDLAPAFFMFPGVGRYDDIYASLLMQRVMRDQNYYIHFGRPFVYQERNTHDLLDDLQAETAGMRHTTSFARFLDEISAAVNNGVPPGFEGKPVALDALIASPADTVSCAFEAMRALPFIPARTVEAGHAFLEDMQEAMGGV